MHRNQELSPGLKELYEKIVEFNEELIPVLSGSVPNEPERANLKIIVNEYELEPSDQQGSELKLVQGE